MALRHLQGWLVSALRSREDLILENLALREQLLALHTRQLRRRLPVPHKLFWVVLQRLWSGWKAPLIVVTPRTVVGWHRSGFRWYWTWVLRASRARTARRSEKSTYNRRESFSSVGGYCTARTQRVDMLDCGS
jgi:hypothetical protein